MTSSFQKASDDIHMPNYLPCEVRIIRESVLVDQDGVPIKLNQAMPKYIPKEPTKACVAGPRKQVSRQSSIVRSDLSEAESDVSSMYSRSTQASHHVRLKRSAKERNRKRVSKSKEKPVNIVGPIRSQLDLPNQPITFDLPHSFEPEDALSVSSLEVRESDEEVNDRRKIEEIIAQKKLIKKLEEDLTHQIKVNAELKKLLVASIGSDLEYRVEKLAKDKAELSATVGNCTERMNKDIEDLDRISIQADMWRSKFLASRLQVEELSAMKGLLEKKYTEAAQVLQDLLEERREICNNLSMARRILQGICTSVKPSAVLDLNTEDFSTLGLSRDILSLSMVFSSTEHRNLKSLLPVTAPLSHKEVAARKVLSEQIVTAEVSPEVPYTEPIPRFNSIFCRSTTVNTKHQVKIV